MATSKKTQQEIYRMPGRKQLQAFLRLHSKLFNLSEMERVCSFPDGTLRFIAAGSREMDNSHYKTIQEKILPKMCEFVVLLQMYENY